MMKATTQTLHCGLKSVSKQILAAKKFFLSSRQCLTALFFIVCLFGSLYSFSAHSSQRYVGDWFETEIILFSQLDSKLKLKEVFNTTSSSPQPNQYLDLLSNYINPDIASLKTHLPSCEKIKSNPVKLPLAGDSFIDIKQLIAPPNQLDTLPGMNSMRENNAILSGSAELISTLPSLLSQPNKLLTENFKSNSNSKPKSKSESKSKAMLYNDKTVFSPILCTISEQDFQTLAINHDRFSYNGFSVNKIPVAINAIENIESETAYLLSKQSLQLAEITDQLKRSKNFKPLLHMAWRQQVFDLKRAIPLKVFAGDTLKQSYFDALNHYQQHMLQKTNSPLVQKPMINNQITDVEQDHVRVQKENQQLVIAKNQQIQNIAKQIDSITSIEQVMTKLALNDPATLNSKPDSEIPPPVMVQPWTLDGFIKLHILDNYLNITSDFSIVQEDLKPQSIDSINKIYGEHENTQTISMRQHRRVISSEIHYFDHPYIGMVIQIRKYQPPAPIINADMTIIN